ncbi:hypothetical protein [Desulfurobacterium atlanticum]|uniref:Uncharacterized protein n=1 Tax=Desulfurobacterium atlanticum TaxID=240169 RepID=A0A238Y3G5_9BACT|nr:hypothetical protein [Desulfurobacterium atlanticum]SNR65755.1 hypothetical protein SAMN06265340_10291 [Desulfurobacterium atlanticum]
MVKNLKSILFPEIDKEKLREIAGKIAGTLIKRFSEYEKHLLKEQFGDITSEVLESEVVRIILEKRQKLQDREEVSFSFLYTIVKNKLIDEYVKKKTVTGSEPIEADVFKEDVNYVRKIFILELVEIVKENFSERELEILCWVISKERKEESGFLKEMSQNAKYKAWSRLKPKLSDVFKNCGGVNEEEFFLFCEIFMSEICSRFR